MQQVDMKVNAHKYVFDVKKDSKVIHLINRKVEELTAINNELQSRDLVYEGYSNRIKLKKEELNNKKRGLESKEKEYLDKYMELIENDEIINCRVKELNKLENILELKINDQGEASKTLLYNISFLREKINSKLIEAEDKEKFIESRERKINEAFENLLEEEKEEYKKLETEHLEKMNPTNYYTSNALDHSSQLKIKELMEKIKQSQSRTTSSLNLDNEKIFPQANEENLLSSAIQNKKVNENLPKENFVRKLRTDFKKRGSFVLDGLNISCLYKCKHKKGETLNKGSLSPLIKHDKNKYTTDHKSNEKYSSLLNNFKLNKTFYLTQAKKIDLYGSVDIDVDSVCGQHCCNKLGGTRYQYHAATHKSLISKQNVERSASTPGDYRRNKAQNNDINLDSEKNKLEENDKLNSSKRLIVNNLEEEKNVLESKANLNSSISHLKDGQAENNPNSDIKLNRNIPVTPSKKTSNDIDNNKNSKHYTSNDVKNIVDTIKSQIYDIFKSTPKKDLKNLKSSLNNSLNNSKILNNSKNSLNNSNKKLTNTMANLTSNSKNLNDSQVLNKSNRSLTGTKALNSSNKSLPPSKTLNGSKTLSGTKVLNQTPKKPINNTVKKIPIDTAKKVTASKMIVNDSNKKIGGAKVLAKDTKATSVTKKVEVIPKKAVTPSKTVVDTKKPITPSKTVVDTKKPVTPTKPVVDTKKTVTPNKPLVDTKKTVTPTKPVLDPKKAVTPSKPAVDTKKAVIPSKPAVDTKKAVIPSKNVVDTKNQLNSTKTLNNSNKELNTSKILNNSNKELNSSKTMIDTKKSSNTSKSLLDTKKSSNTSKSLLDNKKIENAESSDKSKTPVKSSAPLNNNKEITTFNSNNSQNSLLKKSPKIESDSSLSITKNEKFHYFS